MDEILDLNWLKEISTQLPPPVKTRKTIFDIAGFPRWETVNSNTLAFYFDENEEHGFKRLFFNSLLQILFEKNAVEPKIQENFQTNYTVEREIYADSKRIDIVIKSTEGHNEKKQWAVVIENKLFAEVYNDLEVYWNNVTADNKIGVVISLKECRQNLLKLERSKNIKFYNVLHSELINKVASQLPAYYLASDDRHLLILKDYFQNITNMTQPINEMALQKQWTIYRQYADEIENLKKIETTLKEYTVRAFFSAMGSFGFTPLTSYTNVKGKHFIANAAFFEAAGLRFPQYTRFYIWWEDMVAYSSISIYFELYGEHTKYGTEIRERLRTEFTPTPPFQIGINGGVNYDYYHLLVCDHYTFTDDQKNIEDQIISLLEINFFNKNFNVVQKCTEWIDEMKIN